jgi:hypothetical protein
MTVVAIPRPPRVVSHKARQSNVPGLHAVLSRPVAP